MGALARENGEPTVDLTEVGSASVLTCADQSGGRIVWVTEGVSCPHPFNLRHREDLFRGECNGHLLPYSSRCEQPLSKVNQAVNNNATETTIEEDHIDCSWVSTVLRETSVWVEYSLVVES
jgi:hypothetical protein